MYLLHGFMSPRRPPCIDNLRSFGCNHRIGPLLLWFGFLVFDLFSAPGDHRPGLFREPCYLLRRLHSIARVIFGISTDFAFAIMMTVARVIFGISIGFAFAIMMTIVHIIFALSYFRGTRRLHVHLAQSRIWRAC
jgi:hypothetical protein